MNIFYHPAEGRCGDFIPFYFKGEFHLFYIHGAPWEHISTTDFVNFKEHPQALESGGDDAQDKAVFTGSVIEKDGKVHIIYTGHNETFDKQGQYQQVVMHAVSDDCINFEKIPGTVLAPEGDEFGKASWRDPFVYFNEDEGVYHMILTATHQTGVSDLYRRWAITQLFKSKDLENWEKCEPTYAPYTYDTHECPDIFKMGEKWYLIFSTYSKTWETRYRVSDTPYGPWEIPINDTLGGKAFYAAKTVSDGKDRYLVGWTALKEGLKDSEKYHWGGCLTVHKVEQNPDGTMALGAIPSVEKAFDKKIEIKPEIIAGSANISGGKITFENADKFSAVKIAEGKDNFFAKFKVKNNNVSNVFANNFEFVFFGSGEILENWYSIKIEANNNIAYLERTSAFFFDSIFLNENLNCRLDKEFEVKLFIENTCGALYINDAYAISFRCYDFKEGVFAFAAQDRAQIEISDIEISTY